MDIRKWLISPKSTNSTSKSKISDSSEKESSSLKKGSKAGKKRRIIESDSDEEPVPKEKESKIEKNDTKTSPSKNIHEKKKPVSVSDFFGSTPVARNDNKKKKEKTNSESTHEDADFEATLKQLNSKSPKDEISNDLVKKVKPAKQDQKHKSSPKENSGKKPSKKRSSNPMEFEAAPKVARKTIVVDDPKPAPKKLKVNTGYASYLGREGPKALGTKEIPEGDDDCLAGLTFVITGILESIERDDAKSLVEKYGGKVMTTLSKNTKYIVIGRDAGASKMDKAEKLGTKQLDEDGLFELIRTLPGKKGSKSSKKVSPKNSISPVQTSESNKLKSENNSFEDFNDDLDIEMAEIAETISNNSEVEPERSSVVHSKKSNDEIFIKPEVKSDNVISETKSNKTNVQPDKVGSKGSAMWVDKYKPSSIKQIIGQQGDKSNAKKLLDWLVNWRKNRRLNKKPIYGGRFNAHDDGSGYKAALLSGSPGVGKTTTAQLVCKEAGFEYFELNASDTRSKKNLQQTVSQVLGNQTLGHCFTGDAMGKSSSKHAIIMDEVDGMAGNEDRGGMRELIDFIKASKVPIICICNDRNHTKIRSLSNYCFDLKFQKPRVEQIKAAMMSVAFKEGIKVSPEALNDVIVASNQDIRQILHNISMWSAKSKGLVADQTKSDIGRGTKHIKMGPFDVLREVFAMGNKPKASIMDKSDLFFHDYSIAPLFVHENYPFVIPTAAQGDIKKHLTLLSEAADSICIGDIIDKKIRTENSWSLLPTQAIFASVVPGELLAGNLRQMINFPAWLGKNSNKKHMDRVLQELHVHMRMKITGNKTDVALEYLPLLKHALTKPLLESEQDGVRDVLQIMENYYLLREDFDSILDLSLWPDQVDPRTRISPKVKSAFTRAYNKECGKNPYAVTNVKKKKGSAKDSALDLEGNEEEMLEEEEVEDESIENDAMIKVKKPKKTSTATSEASTSKEKKKSAPKKGKSK